MPEKDSLDPAVPALNHCPGCDEYGASHTSPSIEHPAVPAQPCPHEWATNTETWSGGSDTYQVCKKCGVVQDQTVCPAVPAQEAPREPICPCKIGGNGNVYRHHTPDCPHRATSPAEPQAGAQPEPIDAIMTRLYRRFKEWSNRKFSADDVTWCEVKADVLAIIAAQAGAQPVGVCVVCDEAPAVYKPGGWRCLHCADQCEDCDDAVCRMTKPGPCDCSCHVQAGAQVPSWDAEIIALRERLRDAWVEAPGDNDFDWFLIAALQHIRNYAEEAAKTPITRESILAAPQVAVTEEQMIALKSKLYSEWIDAPGDNDDFDWFLVERIARLDAENRARKLTQLSQCDELQGFCRLVLSEIGGGL
jgi:hypothetical protein